MRDLWGRRRSRAEEVLKAETTRDDAAASANAADYNASHDLSPTSSEASSSYTIERRFPGQQFVIEDSNQYRRVWSIILFILLVYTGSIFPYRLCFLDFRIPDPAGDDQHWNNFEIIVDVLFWVDLVVNFFFTYYDDLGNEIFDLRLIVWHYVTGYFGINFLACLPEEVVAPLVAVFVPSDHTSNDSSVHKMARISRLQRITRLARLIRLVRLSSIKRLVAFAGRTPVWLWLQGLRGMRVINFVAFLFWIVHILSCGWYLCAALHIDYAKTWVGRRNVDPDGTLLLSRGSFEQWLNSMYFVFTIFTTVGFGDMSAMTSGEIVYVIFVMLVGAVVHSVIVSEMINIVSEIDGNQLEVMRYREIIDGFAQHARIGKDMNLQLKGWLDKQAAQGTLKKGFDKDAVREIVTNGMLPAAISMELPQHIFGGRLQANKFLQCCLTHTAELPPRASILIALSLVPRSFLAKEIVYQLHDHPFNVFMVDGYGVFAYVAKPTPDGGVDEICAISQCQTVAAASATSMVRFLMPRKSYAGDPSQAASGLLSRIGTTTLERGNSGRDLKRLTTTSKVSSVEEVGLYPYRLYCSGNFFGDAEVLQSGSRRCTARCEESGSLLVLHRQDLWRHMEEFPHFGAAWRANARCRAQLRLDSLAKLTTGLSHRNLAATRIQRQFRVCLQRSATGDQPSDKPMSGRPSANRRKGKSKRLSTTGMSQLSKVLQVAHGTQAEEDFAPHAHGAMDGAWTSQSKMYEIQAEIQHDLHNGLQHLGHQLQCALKELREGEAPPALAARRSSRFKTVAPSPARSPRSEDTRKSSRSKTAIAADPAPSELSRPAPCDAAGDSESSRRKSLQAENNALRALVAEQQRHLDALNMLIPGGSCGGPDPSSGGKSAAGGATGLSDSAGTDTVMGAVLS